MAKKALNGRIVQKHDTATNWEKATGFIPYEGEVIVYDPDASHSTARLKVGDGAHNVNDLPFTACGEINAFSNVKVGATTVAADTITDTLELVGSNVTITPDATNDKITIAVADGTTSAKGIVKLTNSTSSTSTTTAATPSSVKSAYDLANTANTNAANAQTKANSAYALAESKADSLSDLGVTAIATELNYLSGVTSGVQAQLDGKSDSGHTHDDRYYTESEIDTKLSGKANYSHGTHVSYSTTAPVMDGTASVGSASTVARSDHKHPTDTSRAAQADLESLESVVAGKANSTHTHAISDVTNLQSTLDSKTNQNAFSNVKVGSTTIAADTTTDTLTLVAGTNVTITPDATNDKITISATDTNTTYSAGTGISLSGTTFSNSGVRSVATGSANGTISVNTNGTSADIAVKGLGSAAYKATSAFDAAGAADTALSSAKAYADAVKNDLLNGAGAAYDTLKELGDLIDNNQDAIEALETVAAGKADKTHSHAISEVSGLQTALDGKAASSHGTHVTFDSTNKPKMDGTAAFGTSSSVARADHVHPTDTSRASKTEFDSHVADTTKHITSTERTNWGTAYTHSQAAHAPSNAEKNQNAFSNIAVSGQTTVAADTVTDTVTFAGSNVTITTDATNDKVTFAVANGTTSAKGVVQLTNSTSSTSTTTAATPNSVKSAYDLANTAKTNAATAQTKADSAYTLAEGKVGSLSDLGITATATELNYVDGVTSNIQTQLNSKAASSHTHDDRYYTETEINTKLSVKADGWLIGSTDELTPAQVAEALRAGRDVLLTHTDATYGTNTFATFMINETEGLVLVTGLLQYSGTMLSCILGGSLSGSQWSLLVTPMAKSSDIPTTLPNPKAITFTGAVSGTYDGSSAMTVNIPSADFEPLIGTTSNTTPSQVHAAMWGGQGVHIQHNDAVQGTYSFTSFAYQDAGVAIWGSVDIYDNNGHYVAVLEGDLNYDTWNFNLTTVQDGYTPVKGTDYWTEEDKTDIVNQVLATIDASKLVHLSVDENNNITLYGADDGAYTIKYENNDGTTTEICTLTVSNGTGEGGSGSEDSGDTDDPIVTYTNLVPTSLTHTALGTVFNSTGYKDGTYASSSSPYYGSDSATVCTGAIPVASSDAVYIKGITLDASANSHCRVGIAQAHATNGGLAVSSVKAVNAMSDYATLETLGDQYYKLTFVASYFTSNFTRQPYFFLSGIGTGANLVVTVNEPIE